MLTVHHLERSQSERVTWLCEELGIDYRLVVHDRNPQTALAPESLTKLHPAGTAPVIFDGPTGQEKVLGESGACVEYIIHTYGNGKLAVKPGAPNYADYLSWFHFANGSLQSSNTRTMLAQKACDSKESLILKFAEDRQARYLGMLEDRLKNNTWLAGDEFSAADIMTMYSLSTNRGFKPLDLSPYPSILAYLKRASERPAYESARQKGNPHVPAMIHANEEAFKFGGMLSK